MSEHEEDLRPANMLGCEISPNPLDPLAPIEAMCRQHHPDEDMEILSRAYTRAVIQHAEQRRRSGEPYIIHPLAVAQILADLGMAPVSSPRDCSTIPWKTPTIPSMSAAPSSATQWPVWSTA